MNIYKKEGKIVFEFPEWQPRSNPYMEGEDCGMYPTFTGLIVPQKNCSDPEMGFAYTIDMDYKGKPDQWSDIVIHWSGCDPEQFKEVCNALGIDWIEYERCANCKGAIYGTATSSLALQEKYGGAVCSTTCDKL